MSLYTMIRERFAAGVARAFPQRGDDKYLHVSDIASCPTYVLARILGKPMIEPTPSQQIMWQQGLAMERSLIDAVDMCFEESDDVKVWRNKLLWISLDENGRPIGGELSLAAYNRGTLLNVEGVTFAELPKVVFIGHPDAIVVGGGEGLLLETKSERFAWEKAGGEWVAVAPSAPRDKYFVQGPTYAFAAKLPSFAFGVGDRVSGGVQWYPKKGEAYDTLEHLEPLLPKMAALIKHMEMRDIPKPVPPAWAWAAVKVGQGNDEHIELRNVECGRCPYAECVKNQNPLRASAAKETVK